MVEQRQATTKLIRELVKPKFTVMARTNTRPRNIIDEMPKKYSVNMSYKKAWRSKEVALKSLMGSNEEPYVSFAYMLESSNPCSLVTLKTIEDDWFFHFFMYLVAFIQGWPHCRPMLIMDGTYLKAKYRETLLNMCAKDRNQNIFPIAFAIVESENKSSYE